MSSKVSSISSLIAAPVEKQINEVIIIFELNDTDVPKSKSGDKHINYLLLSTCFSTWEATSDITVNPNTPKFML